jgi:hypothetical protein
VIDEISMLINFGGGGDRIEYVMKINIEKFLFTACRLHDAMSRQRDIFVLSAYP